MSVPITASMLAAPKGKDATFQVIFPNHATPRNLAFTITNSMREQMVERLGEGAANRVIRTRVTATGPELPVEPGSKAVLRVKKIEFLTATGKVVGTIE